MDTVFSIAYVSQARMSDSPVYLAGLIPAPILKINTGVLAFPLRETAAERVIQRTPSREQDQPHMSPMLPLSAVQSV